MSFYEYALEKTAEDYGFSPYMGPPERGSLMNDANAGALASGLLGAGLMGGLVGPDLERDEGVARAIKDLPMAKGGKLPARWKAVGILGAGILSSVPGGLLGMAHHGVRSTLFDD